MQAKQPRGLNSRRPASIMTRDRRNPLGQLPKFFLKIDLTFVRRPAEMHDDTLCLPE